MLNPNFVIQPLLDLSISIDYGFHPTPLGECFIALTDRGICALLFIDKTDRKNVVKEFSKDWGNARLNQNQSRTGDCVKRIFSRSGHKKENDRIVLLCRGTDFQIKVWEALLKIPSGSLVSYKTIAKSIHRHRAVRAVANAIGRNPIAYAIPCHRVIHSDGGLSGYRWGINRKRAILGVEASAGIV